MSAIEQNQFKNESNKGQDDLKAHQKSHADKIDHHHRDPSIDEYHVRHFGLYDCLDGEDHGQESREDEEDQDHESSNKDRGANVKLSKSIQ
uniref:Uncharacterized protein n=1 Tax=Acrobeloides nanus TaxID=290746 RepID=A0A914DGI4_9BILA